MRYANRLAHAESLQEQDSAERAYNKLTRTFAAQVEALQRYRDVSSRTLLCNMCRLATAAKRLLGMSLGPRMTVR